MQSFIQGNEYTGEIYKNLKVTGQKFTNLSFEECTFSQCDFADAVFEGCIFAHSQFTDCNFSNAKFSGSRLDTARFLRCKLIGIDWATAVTKWGLKLTFIRSDLSYSSFVGIDVSGSIMNRCKLHEVEFTDLVAKKCKFRRSDFLRATFHKCHFKESDFRKARNYIFNPAENIVAGAKFSYPEVMELLNVFGMIIE